MLNTIIENHDEQAIKEIIINFEAGNKIKEQMDILDFISEVLSFLINYRKFKINR